MKKKTVYSNLKEIIYEFDEYDIKRLILSQVKLPGLNLKEKMTFTFTYKVNSDLNGAIVRIECDKEVSEDPEAYSEKAHISSIKRVCNR